MGINEGEGAGEEAAEIHRGQVMNQLISLGADSFAVLDRFCQSHLGHGTIGNV